MQKMLDLLDDETKTEEEHQKLQKFYEYVRTTVGDIHEAEGRQRIIVELYDKFFKVASPRTVEKLGIVYTPVEVVDFIIRSVGYILRREFGRSLSDENVHILDPFTGTGTFITRLLQSGLISREALERKYGREIHANEIVLMAYYIASVNIENVFHDLMGPDKEYQPFEGICLTDTFQLGEDLEHDNESRAALEEVFPQNSQRVKKQRNKPITVIVGNPPYSIGQKSANDNAQNESYPTLESRIQHTYVALSEAALNKSTYDSYIKAFRWASDRLNEKEGGVIGFITNSKWIEASGLDGMRKCLEKEFSSIYIFNLRGAVRGRVGDTAKKEGQNIFDIMTGVAITILIKKPKASDETARIYYHDIGDYLSREEKLNIIRNLGDISNPLMQWVSITPNEHGDWLNKRSEQFKLYTPLEPEKKFGKGNKSFFNVNGPAVASGRDSWVYNFSKQSVEKNMAAMIDFYNQQQQAYQRAVKSNPDLSVEDFIDTDPTKISWTRSLRNSIKKKITYEYSNSIIRIGTYRPFQKQYLYFATAFNESIGLSTKLLPTPNHCNLIICVTGNGARRGFSVYITENIVDYNTYDGGCQCFPLYWYDDSTADIADLFSAPQSDADRYVRRDGVTDWILSTARKQYGSRVTKEDIFYYVYGILHAPDYRTTFAADLKKSLPRLPLVESPDDFWAFSRAGRSLAELHLGYERVEPYAGCRTIYSPLTNRGDEISYLIDDKMRFGKLDSKTADKRIIHYNAGITIENIPLEAYDYVVNGKSAIEWVMERYAVKTDPASRIENNPNDWCREHDDPKYIYNLLLRIITVSLETMKIVRSLPKLKLEE